MLSFRDRQINAGMCLWRQQVLAWKQTHTFSGERRIFKSFMKDLLSFVKIIHRMEINKQHLRNLAVIRIVSIFLLLNNYHRVSLPQKLVNIKHSQELQPCISTDIFLFLGSVKTWNKRQYLCTQVTDKSINMVDALAKDIRGLLFLMGRFFSLSDTELPGGSRGKIKAQ